MEKTLKQDEIDALFAGGARLGSPRLRPSEAREAGLPYNFSSAGQISNEQLRAISLLNDLFARNLTHNLAAWLRTRFQVNLVSAEQIPFNEFLLRIPEISYVGIGAAGAAGSACRCCNWTWRWHRRSLTCSWEGRGGRVRCAK